MSFPEKYILIVDDNINNLEVTAKILKEEGYRISLAQDGASAIEQLKNMSPDLILLDIMMPVMDGLEVCRILKSDEKTADIPVIFLTAKNQSEDLAAGFEAGGVDYITKPFRREELLVRIKNHLELSYSRIKIIEMNKSRDKLYSIIAHDIRSPLASISMSINSIAQGYIVPGTPEYTEIMEYLDTSSSMTLALLSNLLIYTRSSEQPVVLITKNQNLYPLVLDCINLLKGSAEQKNLNVVFTSDNEVIAAYDELTMHAVFRNIIMNAIKFTPANGLVGITLKNEGSSAIFEVSDTGVGMTEDIVRKIFSDNEHFTSPGTNNEKGTGLGAFIIRDFVNKNNGRLEVKSSPGKGTTVKVFLNVHEQ